MIVYNILVVIGFNDDPVVAGKGSAIFLHLAPCPIIAPTAGCVALAESDLRAALEQLGPGDSDSYRLDPYTRRCPEDAPSNSRT